MKIKQTHQKGKFARSREKFKTENWSTTRRVRIVPVLLLSSNLTSCGLIGLEHSNRSLQIRQRRYLGISVVNASLRNEFNRYVATA